jgi:hypothetical protein
MWIRYLPIVAVALGVVGALCFSSRIPLVAVGVTVFFGVSIVLMRHSERAFVQKVHVADLKCCLVCGYLLQGLPEAHSCPECGSAYDLQDVHRAWRAYARVVE